ncbi:Uncharacterised protein [Ectopseudomonas mendocina]|uniref:Uncharacterized protein n=1 Tax=Ectopseudomonas mendocina TaxID=300 RepID=A0A379IXJ8_ECTME|nr:hypothetical protein [Pseudomonas mendocina]SUD40935.1 Uncharacterised protein [Pseudomonas mendocina]
MPEELIENGMPSENESKLLFDLGDEIESVILKERTEQGAENAMFLARSTWNEARELMFQVHDPGGKGDKGTRGQIYLWHSK